MNKQPDFIAKLDYFTTEQGGRRTPALSGYFPHVRFEFIPGLVGGKQKFLDKEIVYPGDTVTVEISLLITDPFKNKLKKDLEFKFSEGSRIIGNGTILEILNDELLAK